MTITARAIEAAWIRIQEEFLEHPGRAFSAAEIYAHAAVDGTVADAVLETMVDSGVIERTVRGYRLAMPQPIAA